MSTSTLNDCVILFSTTHILGLQIVEKIKMQLIITAVGELVQIEMAHARTAGENIKELNDCTSHLPLLLTFNWHH